MSADSLRAALQTRWIGRELHHAAVIDSTNRWAAQQVGEAVQPDGSVFVADRQTRGRGTGGKVWHSDDADGLWLSIVFRTPLSVAPLSFLPGVALVDLLRDELGVDAHLKWPNDVLVGDRKLAGILVESQQEPGGGTAWIVGVGLNVNQAALPDAVARSAASLYLLTGRRFPRASLLANFLARIERLYDPGTDLVALWRERTRMIGRRIAVARDGAPLSVHVVDVSGEGHLRVVRDDGVAETWVSSTGLEIGGEY